MDLHPTKLDNHLVFIISALMMLMLLYCYYNIYIYIMLLWIVINDHITIINDHIVMIILNDS